MKVIDIENISIPSINQKYIISHGRLVLNPEYRKFKEDLAKCCRRVNIPGPYAVFIDIASYKDIDNSIKPILDALKLAKVITDDREVYALSIDKKVRKRGTREALRVEVVTVPEI